MKPIINKRNTVYIREKQQLHKGDT